MKFLLLVVALLVLVVWAMARQGRRKVPPAAPGPTAAQSKQHQGGPAKMLACARCGVHLPSQEAMFDDTGRAFCGAEHRLAGPG
jgi:uncharacterized protein